MQISKNKWIYRGLFVACCLLSLQACEAIQLLSSVNDIIQPNPDGSISVGTPNPAQPLQTTAATSPQATSFVMVSTLDPNPIPENWNMARQSGVGINVSSTLNATFDKQRLIDGKLTTSWFSAEGDAASLGKLPTVEITFPKPVGIVGVNLRANRERALGLPIQEFSLLLSSAQHILFNERILVPAEGNGDFNIMLKKPVDQVISMRLEFTKDNINSPGLSEIEVVGRQ